MPLLLVILAQPFGFLTLLKRAGNTVLFPLLLVIGILQLSYERREAYLIGRRQASLLYLIIPLKRVRFLM